MGKQKENTKYKEVMKVNERSNETKKVSKSGKEFAQMVVFANKSDEEINDLINKDIKLLNEKSLILEKIKNIKINKEQERAGLIKRGKLIPAKTDDWKNPVEKPTKETPAVQPKGGELLWSGEKPKEKKERVFVPERKNRGTKPPKQESPDLKNANKILGVGLKISGEMVRDRTPEIPKRTEEMVTKDPGLGKKTESDAPTQKQRYEGTVINLYKVASQRDPIDQEESEEETRRIIKLFNHPMTLQFQRKDMTDESIDLVDMPEESDALITGKFFVNLLSTKLKSNKKMLFSIQLRYLGPPNGHQALEPSLSQEKKIPQKGTFVTSSLRDGKFFCLKPIESTP